MFGWYRPASRVVCSQQSSRRKSRGRGVTLCCWLCVVLAASLAATVMAVRLPAAERNQAAQDKPAAEAQPDPAKLEFFEKKIRPVLAQHCYSCHAQDAKTLQANLLLDTREGTRRGGDSGPAVVPGKVDESLILGALKFETFEMPPSGKLPAAVIADFEKWIADGAVDPRDGKAAATAQGIDLEAGRQFWAFRPLERAPAPRLAHDDWSTTEIDRYLFAAMDAAGLQPEGRADRRTLIRRAYFDLIGLPPTPEEIAAFLADDRPDAFARLVDHLLASPHFGERWGRHWLDIARFAESSGGGRTLLFPNAWRYRDYVIAAFNTDKPYDRFICEQIAGDLLPYDTPEQQADNLTALGFLMLGPHNYETQDKELLRMDVVDEQIDTVSKALLGLTVSCARCHDHKFDPIPTRDYYALAGIFRSTKSLTPGNVSGWIEHTLPMEPQQQAAVEAYQAARAKLAADLAEAQKQTRQLDSRLKRLQPGGPLKGIVLDNDEAEVVGEWTASASNKPFIGANYLHDQAGGKGAKRVVYRPKLPRPGKYEVRVSYTASTNRAPKVPVTVTHADGETTVEINQQQSPPIDGQFISLGEFRFEADGASVTVSNRDTTAHVIADAVQFIPQGDAAADNAAQQAAKAKAEQAAAPIRKELAVAQGEVQRLQGELAALDRSAPAIPKVMGVQDEAETGDYHLCIRGNVHNLGPVVPRGFLQVLATTTPAIAADQSGRLELAHWLTDGENPLPARVMVNRIWQHLFEAGLVRSVDNFGITGEQPSHPQLLDYLAAQFIESGWSIKQTIRAIMLSQAYQASSLGSDAARRIDPENRLLSHQHRRRLEGETLRDTMLALSGRLDRSVGGPTIRPGTRNELDYEFREPCRSVYLPVFRNTMVDMLEVFDMADPNIVQGQRVATTRSTQALFLMNSPFVLGEAQSAAAAMLQRPGLSLAQRIDRAYEESLGRLPHSAERELSRQYLAMAEKEPAVEEQRLAQWTRFYQALWASIDFRYVD